MYINNKIMKRSHILYLTYLREMNLYTYIYKEYVIVTLLILLLSFG